MSVEAEFEAEAEAEAVCLPETVFAPMSVCAGEPLVWAAVREGRAPPTCPGGGWASAPAAKRAFAAWSDGAPTNAAQMDVPSAAAAAAACAAAPQSLRKFRVRLLTKLWAKSHKLCAFNC